jgi:GLPGLI family protein
MKLYVLVIAIVAAFSVNAQKQINECTIQYKINVESTEKEPTMADMFQGAKINLYLKDNQSRMETITSMGTTVMIYDSKEMKGVKLIENGKQKFLVRYTETNLNTEFKKYKGATFTKGTETKQIENYTCQKGVLTLANGSSITVYYTTELAASNKKFDFQFEQVPGFVLEYSKELPNLKITYTAESFSLSPVPQSRFEIPTTGYREISYDESQKIK